MALIYDPHGGSGGSSRDIDMDYDRFRENVLNGGGNHRSHRLWERRCRFLCCSWGICGSGDELHRRAFQDVGKIMSFVFDEDIDLVPTDIATGLILINLKSVASRGVEGYLSKKPIIQEDVVEMSGTSSCAVMTPILSPSHHHSPSTVFHFMKYALGSYGWPWLLLLLLALLQSK